MSKEKKGRNEKLELEFSNYFSELSNKEQEEILDRLEQLYYLVDKD